MKAWVNIDIPYTVHLDHDLCSYVVEISKKLARDGRSSKGQVVGSNFALKKRL